MLYDISLLFIYFIYSSLDFLIPILLVYTVKPPQDGCSLAVCMSPAGPVPALPIYYSHDLLALIQLVIVLILRPEELHLLVY